MDTYKTTPNEEAMLRSATTQRSKGRSLKIQPLLYVYPDGGVWLYADSDLSKPHRCYGTPEKAARALQELIERTVAQASAIQAAEAHAAE